MKTIKELDLKNKKVIIRCDFNVPMENGVITDDNRIKESLETINYAISHKAKVILMSHLGRVETDADKAENSLQIVAKRLSELLHKGVVFSKATRGGDLEKKISALLPGDVLLMENTRYEDIDGKKESKNDMELGAYWASLGDLFINDAFGTSHRSHASNVGIASHLPSAVGFLIEKELTAMMPAIKNPKRPLTVILGGSKVSSKIGIISNLVNIADYILIGGGMTYTFLKAQGYEIGTSLLDSESIEFCKEMLEKHSDKIILPVDVICTKVIDGVSPTTTNDINQIKQDDNGVDIGPKSIILFNEYLVKSKTVIWNGPVGIFEKELYASGTKSICAIIADLKAETIIGGGDTASAIINFGFKDKVSHVSTGGGASLELLEGKELPGIAAIK